MMRKNSCLKCGGNVILERDAHGWYEQCLQCSYMRDLATMVELAKIRTADDKRKVLAIPR